MARGDGIFKVRSGKIYVHGTVNEKFYRKSTGLADTKLNLAWAKKQDPIKYLEQMINEEEKLNGIKTDLEIPDIDVTGNFLGVSSPIEIDGFKATRLCIPNIPIKIHKGDILWVRETWQTTWNENKKSWDTIYKADGGYWIDDDGIMKWKPSIYMPKKRARIFLEVTNVRVERLQDITEEDAIAEGIERVSIAPFVHRFKNYLCNNKFIGPKESFKTLWMKINGIDSWKSNPWVWVYEFKQVHHPKDFLNEH